MGDRYHLCAQDPHPGNIGRLLCNVHLAHVYLAFQAKEGGGRCQGHAVLSGAGLCNQTLLAHEFGKKALAHTVVQLVGAGVVKVLPLQVNLAVPDFLGQPLAVVNRCGPALELLAYPAQFIDELGRVADGLVGVCNLLKSRDQLIGQVSAPIRAKTAEIFTP